MNLTKATTTALPYLIVLAGIIFSVIMISQTSQQTKENNFYTRFQACILTIAPSVRTQKSVDSCYDQVEQQTGIKADRYQVEGFKP